MNRRRFLKGTGGGVLGGFLSKFGIFPKRELPQETELNPEPVSDDKGESPYWLGPNSGSCVFIGGFWADNLPNYNGSVSAYSWDDSAAWGISPAHPRCHYCHKYIVRGRETCPHCGGEYR